MGKYPWDSEKEQDSCSDKNKDWNYKRRKRAKGGGIQKGIEKSVWEEKQSKSEKR